MSDPAAVQGQKWADYSATLPVWRFTIKELIFAQHKRAEYFQIRSAFSNTPCAKSTKCDDALKIDTSAFAEVTSASDTLSLSVCEWSTSFPDFCPPAINSQT